MENLPRCEAIIAVPLSSHHLHSLHHDLSQPISPQCSLSIPVHYSHLTGQKIRVKLGGPLLLSPTSLSSHPQPPPACLTHYSQFTGQYMEGDTGPIQSLVPIHLSEPPICGPAPPAGCLCFLCFSSPPTLLLYIVFPVF